MTRPAPFSDLIALYEKMDAAWNDTAARYGFVCNGCQDNCCETLFFHHTHIEKAYLRHGFKTLPLPRRQRIKQRARQYIQAMSDVQASDTPLRIMCPANENGQCTLYRFRPMICRLHGIPHQLKKPGSLPEKSPGCAAGAPLFDVADHPFDRTPFYREMSIVEIHYRKTHGKSTRIGETIAQMLI